MVAHMQAISAPSRKEAADTPQYYAWLLQRDMQPSFAKADMGPNTCGMTPSPEDSSISWEAHAFAEDASSSLAAGIWPPRSYPCSFCRREFRSAQALGGHMNVHRRDRARLRHPSPPLPPFFAPVCPRSELASAPFQRQKYHVTLSPVQEPLQAMLSTSRIPVSMSNTLSTSCTSLTAGGYPSNFAKSYPLHLHLQYASEVASSSAIIQFPQQSACAGIAEPLLRRPASSMPNSVKLACNLTMRVPPLKPVCSSPTSSTVSSARPRETASTTEATRTTGRRDGPEIGPEDESPNKKPHTGSRLRCSQKDCRGTSQTLDEDTEFCAVEVDDENTICSDQSREAICGEDVDLELRLGL